MKKIQSRIEGDGQLWTSHVSPVMRLFEYIVEVAEQAHSYKLFNLADTKCSKDACEEGVSLKWHDRRFEVQEKSHNEG